MKPYEQEFNLFLSDIRLTHLLRFLFIMYVLFILLVFIFVNNLYGELLGG